MVDVRKISQVNIKIGELTDANKPAVSVINAAAYDIEADIPETDIGKIKLLDKVKITYDAFPEEKFQEGKVAQIDPAEKTVEGVIYYKVTVSPDALDSRLKSGMTANLEIIVQEKDDVLVIPQRAVIEKDGQKTVKILSGKNLRQITVTVGLKSNEGEIEIVSGLKEGEIALISEGQ